MRIESTNVGDELGKLEVKRGSVLGVILTQVGGHSVDGLKVHVIVDGDLQQGSMS